MIKIRKTNIVLGIIIDTDFKIPPVTGVTYWQVPHILDTVVQ